jgi:ferric-dicitrate binding protein FerR (iron transport regulator)
MNEVVVPYGKKSQLTLPDGTKVWLNAGSRFAFPSVFYGKKRKVILEGEAYFEVSHNIKEPFIVETQNIDIKVLGTKFNLTAYSNSQKTETVLLEGKISLKNKSQINRFSKDLILKPGQLASYSTDNKNIKIVELNDPDIYIAWTKGWFLFKHENLGNILNKLERYYNISFVYDNSIENNAVLSGKLDLKDSLNNVLEALSDVCKVNFTRNNGVIFVKNNDKK